MATFEYETTSWPQGRRVFTRIAQDSGHTMLSMVVHTMLNEHCSSQWLCKMLCANVQVVSVIGRMWVRVLCEALCFVCTPLSTVSTVSSVSSV